MAERFGHCQVVFPWIVEHCLFRSATLIQHIAIWSGCAVHIEIWSYAHCPILGQVIDLDLLLLHRIQFWTCTTEWSNKLKIFTHLQAMSTALVCNMYTWIREPSFSHEKQFLLHPKIYKTIKPLWFLNWVNIAIVTALLRNLKESLSQGRILWCWQDLIFCGEAVNFLKK